MGKPLTMPLLEPARGDDDAVDAPLGQQLQVHGLAARILRAGAQQQRVPALQGRVLDRPHDLREVGFATSVTSSPSVRVERSFSERAIPDGR